MTNRIVEAGLGQEMGEAIGRGLRRFLRPGLEAGYQAWEAAPAKAADFPAYLRTLIHDASPMMRQIEGGAGKAISDALAEMVPADAAADIWIKDASGVFVPLAKTQPRANWGYVDELLRGGQVSVGPKARAAVDGFRGRVARPLTDALNRAQQLDSRLRAGGGAAHSIKKIGLATARISQLLTLATAGYLAYNLATPPTAEAQKAGHIADAFTNPYGEKGAGGAEGLGPAATATQQYQTPTQATTLPVVLDSTSSTPNAYLPANYDPMDTVVASTVGRLRRASEAVVEKRVADVENIELVQAASAMRLQGIPTMAQFHAEVQEILGHDFGRLGDRGKAARIALPTVEAALVALMNRYGALMENAERHLVGLNFG